VAERFVLYWVGPAVVGVGFSGDGVKFTAAVGRILADRSTAATRRRSSGSATRSVVSRVVAA
jgi:glycine/D-amino acid oxidase-like deaminating enzyme